MNKWTLLGGSLLGVLCLAASMATQRDYFDLAYPENWPEPSYDFKQNPLSREGVALGRMLFYDPILSRDSTISCASCHLSYTAFTHVDHELSHGIEDRIGTRNSPSLMNLAWGKSFMWDGSANHLDMQALSPISAETEMDSDIATVVERLQSKAKYRQLFFQAFDDSTITGEHLLKALAQFQLTFVSANSKYDQIQRKEPGIAFSEQEQKGYVLYKANCASCHQEPLFTNHGFANNGLPMDTLLQDHGRMKISLDPADDRKFKVPTLRNLKFSHPYMHDGRFATLEEVVEHYSSGVQAHANLHPLLKDPNTQQPIQLGLDNHEKQALVAFLHTLSDSSFIRDVRWSNPFDPNPPVDTINTDSFAFPLPVDPVPFVDELIVAPNPSKNIMLFETNSGMMTHSRLQVFSLSGQLVYQETFEGTPVRWKHKAQGVPEGIYLTRLESEGRIFVKKVQVIK